MWLAKLPARRGSIEVMARGMPFPVRFEQGGEDAQVAHHLRVKLGGERQFRHGTRVVQGLFLPALPLQQPDLGLWLAEQRRGRCYRTQPRAC